MKAIEIDPKYFFSHHNLGYALQTKADYVMEVGDDPREILGRAIDAYAKSAELNPKYADARKDAGVSRVTEAEFLLGRGEDPLPSAVEGERLLDAAASIKAGDFENSLARARLAMVRAQWAAHEGASPAPHFEAALSALHQSMAENPSWAPTHEWIAEWHLRRADWLLARRRPIADDVREGLAETERALSINQRSARAMALKGALELAGARASETGRKARDAAEAEKALTRAVEMNPLLKRRYGDQIAEALSLSGSGRAGKR